MCFNFVSITHVEAQTLIKLRIKAVHSYAHPRTRLRELRLYNTVLRILN